MDCGHWQLIVGILSLLVTLLIGWQIYNYIILKKLISRRIEKAVQQSEVKMHRTLASIQMDLFLGMTVAQIDLQNWEMMAVMGRRALIAATAASPNEHEISAMVDTIKIAYKNERWRDISPDVTKTLQDSLEPLLSKSKAVRDFYLLLNKVLS